MGIALTGHEQADVTLALTLSAMREYSDPATIVEDACEWCRYVAIVDRSPPAVKNFAEAHDIEWEFEFDGDKWETMERIRTTTPTPRHVFVGITDGDRTIAMHLDWEFLTAEEAATKADWRVEDDEREGLSFRERILGLWPFG